jgi:hypothetical protein
VTPEERRKALAELAGYHAGEAWNFRRAKCEVLASQYQQWGIAAAEALALLDRAREVLTAGEWIEFDDGHLACPRCECRKADGHWPSCEIGTLLADLGPATAPPLTPPPPGAHPDHA